MGTLTSGRKLSSLQSFRGIAAIFVVLFHITNIVKEETGSLFLKNFFGFGYTGVDFFFVLSGFIIFYTQWINFGQKDRTIYYLVRRFFRIFPIYWIITGFKLVTFLVYPTVAKSYETRFDVILKSIFLIPQQNLPVIGAAWTLSYEMLFYILTAIFIFFGFRTGVKSFLGWMAAILIFFAAGLLGETRLHSILGLNFLLNERNLEFLFGCLAAYLVINQREKIKFPGVMVVTGILFFAASGWYAVSGGNIFSYSLFFGLPSLLLVLGSSVLEAQNRIRWPKIMVFLGDASYSVYLMHAMWVNALLLVVNHFHLFQRFPLVLIGVGVAAGAVIGGCVIYYIFERPIMILSASNRLKEMLKKPSLRKDIDLAEKQASI